MYHFCRYISIFQKLNLNTDGDFYIQFSAIRDNVIYKLGTSYCRGLAKNEIDSINLYGKTSLPIGEYKLMCNIDYYNQMDELDENNNIFISSNTLELPEKSIFPDLDLYDDFHLQMMNITYDDFQVWF